MDTNPLELSGRPCCREVSYTKSCLIAKPIDPKNVNRCDALKGLTFFCLYLHTEWEKKRQQEAGARMTWVDGCQQPAERAAVSAIVCGGGDCAKSHYVKLNLTSNAINSDVGSVFSYLMAECHARWLIKI